MTDIFDHKPGVFTIPSGVPFLGALNAGLRDIQKNLGISPNEITLYLPTRRAIRALQETALKESAGGPILLPALRALGDLDEDDVTLSVLSAPGGVIELKPAISPMRRRFLLQKELAAFSGRSRLGKLTARQRLLLADELSKLLDHMQEEGVDAKSLEALLPEEFAEHWQDVLRFLKVITRTWPKRLQRLGVADPVARRTAMIDQLIAAWKAAPSERPVIAAGTTGSKPAIRRLLKAISTLPRGIIVFPGFDAGMDLESWEGLDETHPQFVMQKTLAELSLNRGKVRPWPFGQNPARQIEVRTSFLKEALRPAKTTDAWHRVDTRAPKAAKTFSIVECESPRIEAGVIALIMRQTLETPGKTAALVTPDRALAQRVRGELKRWNLDVDDSAGVRLLTTLPGAYLSSLVEMVGGNFSPVPLLTFLKHPLTTVGLERVRLLGLARELEILALRGVAPRLGIPGLVRAIEAVQEKGSGSKVLALLKSLARETRGFQKLLALRRVKFADVFTAHVESAEALCKIRGENGSRLWQKAEGERLAACIREIQDHGGALGQIPGEEYPAIFRALLEGIRVRRPFGSHPRLAIWGTLEARLQSPDLMILGGLNEGTWPQETEADPWMSREMRKALGLPTPDFRVGQSAHDFFLCAGANEVVMTRAAKLEGTPTTPSRWLQRIEALLEGAHPAGKYPWVTWFETLDQPEDGDFVDLSPPEPRPPLEHRPKRLSVTNVELLMCDPYAVYAKHILKLQPLDELEMDPGAADRGVILHKIFDAFLKTWRGPFDTAALNKLLEIGEAALASETYARPSVRAFWWPRFVKVAEVFIAGQRARSKSHDVVATEIKGEMEIAGGPSPFILSAKADRIDFDHSRQGYVVIDYKTGSIPSKVSVTLGKKPQLTLEAVMAEAGAFPKIKRGTVSGFEFWNVGKPGPELEKTIFDTDIEKHVHAAREGLVALVNAFAEETTPYLATPDPAFPGYGEYDPLSRLKEWQNKNSKAGGKG